MTLLPKVASLFFLLSALLGAACGGSPPPGKPRNGVKVIENLAYRETNGDANPRQQSLDLYLPRSANGAHPLMVFVHGGFWVLSDDEYGIGPELADELASRGVAVALVRYRLGTENQHPTQADDVAAAVAFLVGKSDDYGFDRRRIFLAGHSAGAHLVSLVALDGLYLKAHGVSPNNLAGVIGISGIYNLAGRDELSMEQRNIIARLFGKDPETLRKASPISHIKSGAPPFLLLSASGDLFGFNVDTRRFSDALNDLGRQKTTPVVVADRDHLSVARLGGPDNLTRDLVLDFLNVKPLRPELAISMRAKRNWLDAAPSTHPFWRYGHLVRSYPVDLGFMRLIIGHYGPERHELTHWSFEKFHAIGLFALLDALPEKQVGQGDYLVLTNVRNEKQVWSKKEISRYDPVVVIGIDDERNLFRMAGIYRMRQEYSWKPGPEPPAMVRPVGAFIYFLKPTPAELRPQSWHFALTEKSFRLVGRSPLAPLKHSLPKKLYEVMTFRNGCLFCHRFRGIGSRSHHTQAKDGAPHGGFALSLEEYPPEVWKAFVFEQEAVAERIGATPNWIDEPLRRPLYEQVVRSREQRTESAIFRR